MDGLECYDIRVGPAMSVLYFELRERAMPGKEIEMGWKLNDCMTGVVETGNDFRDGMLRVGANTLGAEALTPPAPCMQE
jgi:hypothetical protein